MRLTDEFDKMLWMYRAVFTQTNVAGGTIKVTIAARERMQFFYGRLGPDNYAAGRTLVGTVTDSAGNTIARVLFASPVDDASLPIPWLSSAAVTAEATNNLGYKLTLAKGDSLVLNALTLVQNETFTVALRALVPSCKPNVVTTGSGGTVTTTTTYDKIG